MLKTIDFLKELQEQMQYEDQHDNDMQASPRFWVIMDYRTEPTLSDYADGHLYYYNDGDFKDFETNKDIIEFFQRYSEDDYDELVELCMSYHDLKENEIIDEIEFEDLWELVIDHLNEDGFFSDVPTRTESYIVPNTMFLTKKGAKEHLKQNSHHYTKEAHTYAMTAHRSPRVEQLVQILIETDWDRVTEIEAENETLHSTLENERKENVTLTNENQRVKKRNRRLSKSVSELKQIVNNDQYRRKWIQELEKEK